MIQAGAGLRFSPLSLVPKRRVWVPGLGPEADFRLPVSSDTVLANEAQIVAEADDNYLVLGFAGRITGAQKADCVALPIKPELMPGDTALSTTTFARLEKVTVIKVDPEIGRVFIRYTSAGKERELAVPYGNITKGL